MPEKSDHTHELGSSVLDDLSLHDKALETAGSYPDGLVKARAALNARGFCFQAGDAEWQKILNEQETARAESFLEGGRRHLLQLLNFSGSGFKDLVNNLEGLDGIDPAELQHYRAWIQQIEQVQAVLQNRKLQDFLAADPRHAFILAGSERATQIFDGYHGTCQKELQNVEKQREWRLAACAILKSAFPERFLKEGDETVRAFYELAGWLEQENISATNLHRTDLPVHRLPEDKNVRILAAQIQQFFEKIAQILQVRDGVLHVTSGEAFPDLPIKDVSDRLKSQFSMWVKLCQSKHAHPDNLPDPLALTFELQSLDDFLLMLVELERAGLLNREEIIPDQLKQTIFTSKDTLRPAVAKLLQTTDSAEDKLEEELDFWWQRLHAGESTETKPGRNSGHKLQAKLQIQTPILLQNDEVVFGGPAVLQKLSEDKPAGA